MIKFPEPFPDTLPPLLSSVSVHAPVATIFKEMSVELPVQIVAGPLVIEAVGVKNKVLPGIANTATLSSCIIKTSKRMTPSLFLLPTFQMKSISTVWIIRCWFFMHGAHLTPCEIEFGFNGPHQTVVNEKATL